MGSVLVMSPSNNGLAERLAFEGVVVKVFEPFQQLEKENPRRIGSLRMLDQYDFALIGDQCKGNNLNGCRSLGSSSLHLQLQQLAYLKGVIKNLTDCIPVDEMDIESEIETLTLNLWFDGREFVYNGYYVDYIRLAEGDRGPITSGMGFILWKANANDELLKAFQGLKKLLVDLDYVGPLTIGCALTEGKIYVGEIRVCVELRHLLWHELAPKGLYNMFLSLSVDHKPSHILEDYAVGVCCVVLADQAEYKPIFTVDEGAEKHFYSGIATARGDTVYEVRRRVYRTLKNTTCNDPEIIFRNDIGAGVEAKIGKLKRWGWLNA